MLRLLSSVPRLAVRARVAQSVRAPVAAVLSRTQPQRLFTSSSQRCAKAAAVQEAETNEVEEEKKILPVPEAASGVVTAVAAELASFDTADEFVESYVKEHQLTVNVNMEYETLVMTRKNQNHEIRITMRAEVLQNEDENEEQDPEDEQEKLPEHRFWIDVTNPKGNIIRMECFNAPQGELEVGALSFPSQVSPDLGTMTRAEQEKLEEGYPVGLRVDEMEEASSQAFFAYLESIGVDDDLAVFIASQAQLVRTKAQIARMEKLKAWATL